ncbi:MAG: FdhF/YdeP family oxidoreductase [Woeseia sp.]|nr:FdhF/YdeP family oxidoreductase [Woeseia sp.]NNE61625.1 FdhF/YdeP family oxidoreductase [Woeseia sp.]NNL55339.1 FdhF/YdeP family oxidoreductase [Woeseia sp.]
MSKSGSRTIIGGGGKKVLYTLDTVRRIGLLDSAKALRSKNTCKACALGMGGQHGGMVNELGEFPSICNKSVQAQSTDIQPPIPLEVFSHPLEELRELSGHELEHLGRLGQPLHKQASGEHYSPISWEDAIALAAERFRDTKPDRSFFYSSGRSSNEAGFLLQLVARLYGTNNVNNCSYYCHEASGVALGNTIGTGTSTVELADLSGCDLFFLIGANPASNHPRLLHKLKALRDRGGDVVVINPARESGLVRFAVPRSPGSMLKGGDWIASEYLQPRIGSDVALLKGIAKAIIEAGTVDEDYLERWCEGYEEFLADIESTTWDDITDACEIPKSDMQRIGALYSKAKKAVFAWGMGVTHHLHGVENIEYISNLALLRGMVGKPQAGLLPLRGHSNVQGIGTIGVKPVLPEHVFARLEEYLGVTLPKGKGVDTLAGLEAAERGEIDAALMMGGNLYAATPNSRFAASALENIKFKMFLTTTLNLGHVHCVDAGEVLVLPVTARDEEPQPTTQESMFNYVRLSDGGIERLAGVRSEVSILADLALQLLPDCALDFDKFKEHRYIREAIAATIPGMEQLADIDVAKKEFHIRGRLLHKPEFKTSTGRARLVTHPLTLRSQNARKYPYMLTSVRSEGQFNTIIYEEKDSYRGTDDRWSVLMHKEDIDALGLQPGDLVTVRSPHGEMRNVRTYVYGLRRGDVMTYFPEANALTGRSHDQRSKTPNFKSVPVAIRPA